MSQLTYTEEQGLAIIGAKYDLTPDSVSSYENEEVVAIDFGVGVLQGTADRQALLPAGNIDNLVGLVVHSHDFENRTLAADEGVAVDEMMNVANKGRFWVEPEVDVAPGDPVFLRHTVNGQLTPGHWRNDADTANALEVTSGARWFTSGGPTSGNLAVLELNLP